MSKSFRLVSLLLAVLMVSVMVSGCRRPKLNLNLRDPLTGADGIPVGGGGMEFNALPPGASMGGLGAGAGGGDGWVPEGASMNTGDAASMAAKRVEGVVVYFGYDSAAVGPSEMPKIETIANHMKAHPDYAVTIEGHCDERGSDEYNRALGQQRAIVVRDLLCSLAIDGSRIETVSYGEERPVVPNATSEGEWQQNRRAEFLLGPMK